MNSLFFEHPNKRERINLAYCFSVELFSSMQNKKKRWSIIFHGILAVGDKPMAWHFSSEDEARDTFMAIADLMRDYLYAAVLPDYVISKDYVEYINVAPSEDGWSLSLHIRFGNNFNIFSFSAGSEEEAMRLYKAFIVA